MKKMDKNSHSSGGLWQKQVRVMKLCFILTFIGIMHLSAATYSQDTRLDLKVKNATLESVMNNIRTQSEYSFFFDDVAVKKISNITLNLQNLVHALCIYKSLHGIRHTAYNGILQ